MHILEATYRIVTPMFIGDANQKASGIRPPSVKGALRFWWRALNWGRCLRESNGDETAALKYLHEEEKRLFGLAAVMKGDEQAGGQGCFLLQVDQDTKTIPLPQPQASHAYLLGQGLYHFKKEYLRSAIATGKFTIKLIFKPTTSQQSREAITNVLLAFGLMGGLGSRSRKGLGSIAIESLKIDGVKNYIPIDLISLKDALHTLIDNQASPFPPYSAFSQHSRIISIAGENDGWKLLGKIGQELQLYRSYGQNGKVGSILAERNFIEDHDLALAAIGGVVKDHPKRLIFGLPHNYFFSSTKTKLDISPTHLYKGKWTNEGRNRRAGPLFIHIHCFPDGSYAGVLTFLPAQFLPIREKVEMKSNNSVNYVDSNVDWTVIYKFLDRFTPREEILR